MRSENVKIERVVIVLLLLLYGVGFGQYWLDRSRALAKDFSCNSELLSKELYLVGCSLFTASRYELWAYFFDDAEPTVVENLKKADVLFFGNSRLQFALSTDATVKYFKSHPDEPYYLAGFTIVEGVKFVQSLILKHDLRPKVVVVNADQTFFKPNFSIRAKSTIEEGWWTVVKARLQKSFLDWHAAFCRRYKEGLSDFCGTGKLSTYRSRQTGFWVFQNFQTEASPFTSGTVPPTAAKLAVHTKLAEDFLRFLRHRGTCLILTSVPNPATYKIYAENLARNLKVPYVGVDLDDLRLLDESHISPDSAERWSREFFKNFDALARSGKGGPAGCS